MSIIYKVTLKPQEPFFFGGENTFAKDDTKDGGTRYSATSTYFPQQSSILGMLRKTILIQNGNLTMHLKGEWVDSRGKKSGYDKNYEEAVQFAGKGSFSYEKENDFGMIENISPIFITRNEKDYIINAKDESYTPKLLDSKMSINGQIEQTFFLEGFDAKEYKEDSFIATDKTELSYDKLFAKVQTVGITKSKDGASEEDAFFQKTSLHLRDNATFSFFIKLQEKLRWSEAYVTLGAEQSSFHLKLEETQANFKTTFANIFTSKPFNRVILHSETLVEEDVYKNSLFVLGNREVYRQIDTKSIKKSKRYYLLQRGSVIYAKDLEKLEIALAKPHLQRVGINIFTTIKKGTQNV